MFVPDFLNAISQEDLSPTLLRLAPALRTGAFVGLESEHRGKAGARTFAFDQRPDQYPAGRPNGRAASAH
jgi:hypothetical protein